MRDLANRAAVACVLSPLNCLNSYKTLSRVKPNAINSFTSASVNLSLGNICNEGIKLFGLLVDVGVSALVDAPAIKNIYTNIYCKQTGIY